MKLRLPLLLSLLVLWFGGCADVGTQSSALRIGMTREQALAIMGQPSSVAAQGTYEYLNYSANETMPGGLTVGRPYYVRIYEGKVEAFGYSDQIFRMAPPLSGAQRDRSAALKIGMTKPEAIAAMGQPVSVSAQGSSEYLNYTLTEVNGPSLRSITRPYYVRLVDGKVEAFGYPEQIGRAPATVANASTSTPATTDTVTVTGIEPITLVAGRRQSVTVRVHYSIQTRDHAVIAMLFNTADPQRFRPVPGGEAVVAKGSGDVELHGNITPVDWGAAAEFSVRLHVLEYPHVSGQFSAPLSSAQRPIPLGHAAASR